MAFCLVGAWDDRRPIRRGTKLAGMFLAALPFALLGPPVAQLELLGFVAQFSEWGTWGRVAGGAFTVVWLVGWANVVNLSDGLDGLATGGGIIVSVAIAVHGGLVGQWGVSALALTFAAAALGFFPHNMPTRRAKIFLGDSGSLPMGACLGMLSLWIESKTFSGVTAVGVLAAGAVSGWDVFAAMARRKLTRPEHRRRGPPPPAPPPPGSRAERAPHAGADPGDDRPHRDRRRARGPLLRTPYLAPAVCVALFAALACFRVFGHHEAVLLGTWAGDAWKKRPVRRVRGARRRPTEDPPPADGSPADGPPADVSDAEPARRAA